MSAAEEDLPKSLWEHLEELRSRILYSLAGCLLGSLVVYYYYPVILAWLIRPPIEKLIFTSPMEPFFAQVKLSLAGGFVLAYPWVFYHAWAFVSIALKPKERMLLFRILPVSYVLFLLGGSLGLFVIGPLGLKFLLSFSSEYLLPYITVNSYLSYMAYLSLGSGILFQLPIVLYILSLMGIVTAPFLVHYRRHVFIGILLTAALITPSPDIFGQVLIAIPAYLLYELSILFIRFLK